MSAHLPEPLRDALSQQGEIVEALVVPASDQTFRRAAAELAPQGSDIVSPSAIIQPMHGFLIALGPRSGTLILYCMALAPILMHTRYALLRPALMLSKMELAQAAATVVVNWVHPSFETRWRTPWVCNAVIQFGSRDAPGSPRYVLHPQTLSLSMELLVLRD